jgi:hypothetical protein
MLAYIEHSSSRKYSLGHGGTGGAIFKELTSSSDTHLRCSEDPGSTASGHHATAYMPICMKPTAPQQQKPSEHSKQAHRIPLIANNAPLLLFCDCFKTDQSHSTVLATAGGPAAQQ